MSNNYLQYLSSFGSAVKRFVSPDLPQSEPTTLQYAKSVVSRERLTQILGFKDYDETRNLVVLDDGHCLAAGFLLELNPLAYKSVEESSTAFADLIARCPEGTLLQFSKLNSPEVAGLLGQWGKDRVEKDNIVGDYFSAKIAHLSQAAKGPSAVPGKAVHPRIHRHFLAVRIPFKGAALDKNLVENFFDAVAQIRGDLIESLQPTGFEGRPLIETEFKALIGELLNPHLDSPEDLGPLKSGDSFENLIEESTSISFEKEGYIGFADAGCKPEVAVVPLTVDTLTETLSPQQIFQALGSPFEDHWQSSPPYFAYTQVQVMGVETLRNFLFPQRNKLKKSLSANTSQLRAEAGTFYSTQQFEDWFEDQVSKGVHFVRGFTGINLYCPPSEAKERCSEIKKRWRQVGLKLSEEMYIGFPVFALTLPLVYSEGLDPLGSGISRGACMSTKRISNLLPVGPAQPDEKLLNSNLVAINRHGQLRGASTNGKTLMGIGASAAGKSAIAKELIYNKHASGGKVHVLDFGGTYRRIANNLQGTVFALSVESPLNLNPFLQIRSQESLKAKSGKLAQWIHELVLEPVTSQEALLELQDGIEAAWQLKQEKTMLADVAKKLGLSQRPSLKKLAGSLSEFLTKKSGVWFNVEERPAVSPPDSKLRVYELSQINQDPTQRRAALKGLAWAIGEAETDQDTLTIIEDADILLQGSEKDLVAQLENKKGSTSLMVFCNGFDEISKSQTLMHLLKNADALMIFQQNSQYIDSLKKDPDWEWSNLETQAIANLKANEHCVEFIWKEKDSSCVLCALFSKTAQLHFTNNSREIARIEKSVKSTGNLRITYRELAP